MPANEGGRLEADCAQRLRHARHRNVNAYISCIKSSLNLRRAFICYHQILYVCVIDIVAVECVCVCVLHESGSSVLEVVREAL